MNIPIWPGSSSFAPGDTPFGFYDYDYQFRADIDKFAVFASRRMGYPIIDIELQDINFYAAFEQAVTTYGNEVYSYLVRQNYLDIEGASTSINFNNALVTPNMSIIIRIAEQYGVEAGTGGNISYYSGSIPLQLGVQNYDLNAWASQNGINGADVEIKRVFYESPPAITKYFDPYAGTGTGIMNLVDSFGWGNYSPAINFLLMPFNYDLQKIQAIEFNDQIRKANYSFEINNNLLRIFPIPTDDVHVLHFHYMLKSDRLNNNIIPNDDGSIVTNVSNVPFTNPVYSQINSIGRSWIFEYALAICKEMLGYVRGKYAAMPIPGDSTPLNQSDLITAATKEKEDLITKLRTYLTETSRDSIMTRKNAEEDHTLKRLQQAPFYIYIG
jgi:hypothetical protein